YFLLECTTASAPSASGCCRYGVANVLSTTTRAERAWAMSQTAATATMESIGFVGVSTHTRRVSSRHSRSIASIFRNSTAAQPTPQPPAAHSARDIDAHIDPTVRLPVDGVSSFSKKGTRLVSGNRIDLRKTASGNEPRPLFVGESIFQQEFRRIHQAPEHIL